MRASLGVRKDDPVCMHVLLLINSNVVGAKQAFDPGIRGGERGGKASRAVGNEEKGLWCGQIQRIWRKS